MPSSTAAVTASSALLTVAQMPTWYSGMNRLSTSAPGGRQHDRVAERHGEVLRRVDQDRVQEQHHAGSGGRRVAGIEHRRDVHPGRTIERTQRIPAGRHARMAIARSVVDPAVGVVDLAERAAGSAPPRSSPRAPRASPRTSRAGPGCALPMATVRIRQAQ